MKKILSFMLVLSMLFSMVSFAIPVAEVVESAAEVSEIVELSSEETAETFAEGDGYVTVIDFESDSATVSDTAFVHSESNNGKAIHFSAFDYATYRQNITSTNTAALPQMHFGWVDGFYQQETVGDATNKYLRFEGFDNGKGSGYRFHRFRIFTDTFTTPGTYTVSFKARRPAGATWSNLVYGYDPTGSYAQNITAKNVPATWTEYSFDVEVDETTTLGYISFQWTQSKVNGADSDPAHVGDTAAIEFDDIKYYYTAPVVASTVSFDANGVEATVPSAIETTVGETVDLAGYEATTEDETKNFLGWATTATGEVITSLEVSEVAHTLYAIWETVEPEVTYPENGYALIIDFEHDSIVPSDTYFSHSTSQTGSSLWFEYFDFNSYRKYITNDNKAALPQFSFGWVDAFYKADENGNKYLHMAGYDNGQGSGYRYHRFRINTPTFSTPGTYTITFKARRTAGATWSQLTYNAGVKENFSKKYDNFPTKWTEVSVVVEVTADSAPLDAINFAWVQSNTTGADYVGDKAGFDIDDVKIYYTAPVTVVPATVTFDTNGVAATVPDAITTTTGTEIDLTTYTATTTDETKEFVGWATTADGEVITSLEVSEVAHTLYAIWEEVVVLTDCTIVDVDFEKVAVGSVLLNNNAANTNITWRAADNKAVDNYRIVRGDSGSGHGFSGRWLGGNAVVAEVNGNKVMKVVTSVGVNGGYSQFSIRTPGMATEGTYTVSFKYMIPTESTVDRIMFFPGDYTDNSGSPTVTNFVNQQIQKGVWYTYYDTVKVGSGGHAVLESIKFRTKTATADSYIYIDDINYYYETPKTPSVVTFATTNGAVDVPGAIDAGIGGRVDLSLYTPKVNDSTLKFVGWSTTTDASGIIAGGIFTPTEAAHTLYAITEAVALVHPYFSTEFNDGDKVIFADGIGQVGGVDEYSKAHTVVNGFLRTTFTDLNLDKNGIWIADPIQTHKYVTSDTPLVKDDIKGLAVAYKFNDTVYNGDWSENTIDNNKDYNKAELLFGDAGATDSQLTYVGSYWQYNNRNAMVYYDFANDAKWISNWTNVPEKIGIVRFDLLQGAYDGMSYDLDYVKFVLADDRIIPVIPAERVHAFADRTITFTYPEGINADDAAALTAADFGNYAKSFAIDGNTITVTVNNNYIWDGNVVYVTSPGVKNTAGDKTYVTTYYAMEFESLGAPETIKAAQIRTDAKDTTTQGMRYAAYIETAAEACEYGYIVTLESLIDNGNGTYDYGKLAIDGNVTYNGTAISGTNTAGVKIVGAVAITGTGAKTIYSTTGEQFGDYAIDDGLYFTTVLTGIPNDKESLTTRFVGRPYVKLTDDTYVYGAPITRSLYDVAKAKYDAEGMKAGMYVLKIIMTVEG